MSIQWTFIAGYLYFEVAVVIIMILPIFSPKRWNQFFKSRLFAMFQQHAAVYFYVLLGVLCLFLFDAIREMRKYSHSIDAAAHTHLSSEMKGNVKLFRAQRNFYITGFAIFLAFVIRRLVNMLIIQDELSIKAEKIIKEAEAAVQLAKTTVLANTLQASEPNTDELKDKLLMAEDSLKAEKSRVKELEEEAKMWKQKYEEAVAGSVGKGDE
ncbi:B-cell receptor-associated protein 31-like [Anticarsia gemmatalis]|uniref:B-cell receptor-associated protein 31-like n=1 Tax=Anticarsia gemmatalis TaxID=129554 RepID=UPI003F76E86F